MIIFSFSFTNSPTVYLLYSSNKYSMRLVSLRNCCGRLQRSIVLSNYWCAFTRTGGMVLESYRSARLLLGNCNLASNTACANFPTASFCLSLGLLGQRSCCRQYLWSIECHFSFLHKYALTMRRMHFAWNHGKPCNSTSVISRVSMNIIGKSYEYSCVYVRAC